MFSSSSISTLHFYSYFGGINVGSLNVSTIMSSGQKTSLWFKQGEHDPGWLLSCVPFKKHTNLSLEFIATASSDGNSVIAIDNVTVSDDPCRCKDDKKVNSAYCAFAYIFALMMSWEL